MSDWQPIETSTKETPVQTFRVDLICGCGGTMRRSSLMVYTTHPPQYDYTCEDCKTNVLAFGLYPKFAHRAEPPEDAA